MAFVESHFVFRFGLASRLSERGDEKHPVSNIMSTGTFKKWLSDPRDRTGVMEAIFQLEYPCCISYINIGSIWCASAEVKVGRSDWPAGRDYETLIYAVSLMTLADCTLGKNPVKTEMFTADSFCPTIARQQWDRIKVTCRQPYKKMTQFGLSFLHVKTTTPTLSSGQTKSTNKGTSATSPVSTIQINTTGKKVITETNECTSVQSIKQHFLGKIQNGQAKSNDELKSKLLKIAASSESGVEADSALSRTAKLVLAASEDSNKSPNIPKTSDGGKRGLYSNHLDQKYGPQFEEEVKVFLSKLAVDPKDLDNITLADVRHKFEKKKRRKLTREEKKIFAELTTQRLSEIFNVDNDEELPRNKPVSCKSGCTTKVKEVEESTIKLTEKHHAADRLVQNVEVNLQKEDKSLLTQRKGNAERFSVKNESKYGNTENERLTPMGKRKLNALDDTITPPSKKLISEDIVNKLNANFENNFGVLKAKNGMNRFSPVNVESKINVQYKSGKDSESNDPLVSSLHNGRGKTPRASKQEMLDSSTGNSRKNKLSKGNVKKDSSFGEFLMNMTLSSSDIDSDDDDVYIPFPEQKTPSRGRGRGRGSNRGKKNRQSLDLSHVLESPSIVQESSGRKRGRSRGRGRGRTPQAKDSPSVNSLETRPTGFAKCEGCGEYYGEPLLSVHQDRCKAWKSKQGSLNHDTDTPWLSARPETPTSSSKKKNPDISERSPPWVMAALAAERRLNEQREGKQTGKDVLENKESTNASSEDMRDRFGLIIETQRKALENISKDGVERNNYTLDNQSQIEIQEETRHQSISINQSGYSNVLASPSSSRMNSNVDLTMDSDTDDEYMDKFLPPVQCPLCGDLFPTSVVEAHAANCGL